MSRKSLKLAFGISMLLYALHSPAGTLAQAPLTLQSPVPPNVLFSLSVEFPTAITAAYQGANNYSESETYLGLFDPAKCYSYSSANAYFSPAAAASNHACSGYWSGNFLNWATMTGLDEFRFAMTGGNRYIDTATLTVLERAYQSNQGSTSNFTDKTYSGASATPYPSTTSLTIKNWNQGTQMQVVLGGNSTGTAMCANPQLSGSTFSCDLTMQNTNETGSCTSWTGSGTNASPYRCSTFGAFAGVGTPTGSTPGTKSPATSVSTDTVTCTNPSGTSSSNFNCTLRDTQSNTGSCTAWTGNGTSTSPFSCSTFGTFGSATFTSSSQGTASRRLRASPAWGVCRAASVRVCRCPWAGRAGRGMDDSTR